MMHRGETPKSPVHIHVKDTTPVHVHVQKPIKPRQQTLDFNVPDNNKTARNRGYESGNLRHAPGSLRSRSRSPAASKATGSKKGKNSLRSKSPGVKYSWQSPTHRLDILRPEDEDENVVDRVNQYQKQLSGLKSEVGALKTQVEHQRALREIDEKEGMLEEQEEELEKCKYELEATESENRKLRWNIGKLCDEIDLNRPELVGDFNCDRIIKKLLEAELDGEMLSKQAALFADAADYLKADRRLSAADCAALRKQKVAFDEAVLRFNATSHTLRSFLRERKEQELNLGKIGEQRDLLMTKLARVQDERQVLKSRLLEREHQISDLLVQLDAQKEENVAVSGQQSSLKVTKAHLQNHLRQKEGDCNRMAVQIRTLESQLAQERIDTDHLRDLLAQSKDKVDLDKEALKKATRLQKMRASKSEDALEQVKLQLMEREVITSEQQSELDMMHSQMSKLSKERSQAVAELSACKIRLEEVESLMDRVENDAKDQVEVASSKFHEKASEASSLRLENERLKNSLASLESKLSHADADIAQLRANVREYEPLVNEYRSGAERQANQLSDVRDRHIHAEDENKVLLAKMDLLDKKLSSVEDQNRELISVNAKREEALNQINLRLEERVNENVSLQRQLDSAVAEMRRLKEQQREKIAAAERELQTRILDLETQLSQSKADISRVKREKEEAERKFNSRLYDLNDELQQSYGSNRSLQNYVQFLKASYASSFNDLAGMPSLSPQRTSLF